MPQALLPLFPEGATAINEILSFQKKDGTVYYFQGCLPVFSHDEDDVRSFRMFTSQLYINGNCTQSQITRAFGVSSISVKRWVKKYREGGPEAFYRRPRRAQPRVLTAEVLRQAQEKLAAGQSRSEVADSLGIKPDTLRKTISSGRLVEAKKKRASSARRAGGA